MVTAGAKGINAAIDAYEFNHNINMEEPTVNDKTEQVLNETDEYLKILENSPSIPTSAQLRLAAEKVDKEGNVIMDNLIRNSFSQQYPNLTIPEGGVVLHYNKNHDSLSTGELGNYVYITCKDANGNEYKYTIKDFRSQGENRIQRLFDDERSVDELQENVDSTQAFDFTGNSSAAKQYLNDLRKKHEHNVELAKCVIIVDSAQISYDNTDKNDLSIGDRIALEASRIFSINPSIKTVSPEKVENSSIEHDDR